MIISSLSSVSSQGVCELHGFSKELMATNTTQHSCVSSPDNTIYANYELTELTIFWVKKGRFFLGVKSWF